MPKSSAPFEAPAGKKWCSKHSKGGGSFLPLSAFPSESYSYCRECKREYQRVWDKTKRVRPPRVVKPEARISKDQRVIIIHLPNTEKGRNAIRNISSYWPDSDLGWE